MGNPTFETVSEGEAEDGLEPRGAKRKIVLYEGLLDC